ncbi:hypothetical protein SCHPADRAFT_806144, partial [Schizopora paradoxa]
RCGQQKYNAHLLCKHLVQAVSTPPSAFWHRVARRRTIPFYIDPDLKPIRDDLATMGNENDNDDPMGGSITEGDDREWDG